MSVTETTFDGLSLSSRILATSPELLQAQLLQGNEVEVELSNATYRILLAEQLAATPPAVSRTAYRQASRRRTYLR